MAEMNCPNCGSGLDPKFGAAKMTTCPSCSTTLYLTGAHIKNAGSSGEMHDSPLLIKVGQLVDVGAKTYNVLGHARFDYGRGWWDEFFAISEGGGAFWISVDEGDIVLQEPLPKNEAPNLTSRPRLGASLEVFGSHFRVSEHAEATCIAVRGDFPEVLYVGAQHTYVNCQGQDGLILSGEFSSGTPDWYIGQWLDPFELQIRVAA